MPEVAFDAEDNEPAFGGRRCELGCVTWPDLPQYHECPICGEPTEAKPNFRPLDEDDAAALAFEEYYKRRCEARGVSVEGDFPPNYKFAFPIRTDLDGSLSELVERSRKDG